jgi:hypothetical protein
MRPNRRPLWFHVDPAGQLAGFFFVMPQPCATAFVNSNTRLRTTGSLIL